MEAIGKKIYRREDREKIIERAVEKAGVNAELARHAYVRIKNGRYMVKVLFGSYLKEGAEPIQNSLAYEGMPLRTRVDPIS